MNNLCIDLGCGSRKKPGMIGVDMAEAPGVDVVVNFEREPLPFPDRSVKYVHLSHCMEHISKPEAVFREISRVCQDGARIDVWGPYTWENSAFIFDHRNFFNEDHFYHPCVWFPDFWWSILQSRWLLHGFTYVVAEDVLRDIEAQGLSAYFAIRYLKGVVKEFCAHIEVRLQQDTPSPALHRHLAVSREAARYRIPWQVPEPSSRNPVERVLKRLGLGAVEADAVLDGAPPCDPAAGQTGSEA